MSLRAWLVRRTIYSIFRKPVKGQPLEARMKHFAVALDKVSDAKPFNAEGKAVIVAAEGYPGMSEWVIAHGADQSATILYSHGGGYVWGSPVQFRDFAWRLSAATGARVLMLDYPLAPEATAPQQGDVALAAYRRLLDEVDPGRVILAGDSAGGGLTMTLALRLKAKGVPLPAGIVLLSPWLDLTGGSGSVRENQDKDVMIDGAALALSGEIYAGGLALDDPEVSPLFGDLSGLPPILTQVGSTEVLRDDSTRLAEAVRAAGGQIRCDVWKNMHHDFQMSAAVMPESRKAIADMARFIQDSVNFTNQETAA